MGQFNLAIFLVALSMFVEGIPVPTTLNSGMHGKESSSSTNTQLARKAGNRQNINTSRNNQRAEEGKQAAKRIQNNFY